MSAPSSRGTICTNSTLQMVPTGYMMPYPAATMATASALPWNASLAEAKPGEVVYAPVISPMARGVSTPARRITATHTSEPLTAVKRHSRM